MTHVNIDTNELIRPNFIFIILIMSEIVADPYATPPMSPVPRAASMVDGWAKTITDDAIQSDNSTSRDWDGNHPTESWPDSVSIATPNVEDGRENTAGSLMAILKAGQGRARTDTTALWVLEHQVGGFCQVMIDGWKKDAKVKVAWTAEFRALTATVKSALKGLQETPVNSLVLHEFVSMAFAKEPPSNMSNTNWQDLWKECIKINPDKGKA